METFEQESCDHINVEFYNGRQTRERQIWWIAKPTKHLKEADRQATVVGQSYRILKPNMRILKRAFSLKIKASPKEVHVSPKWLLSKRRNLILRVLLDKKQKSRFWKKSEIQIY